TAFGIAQRVELELNTLTDTKRIDDAAAQRDHFDVGLRLCHADKLDSDLMELAKAAPLRSLIAEHRTAIEEFERHALGEAVGDHRANHPGSVFWPQRDFLAAAVVEGVHFLRNDVGVLADRSRENFGELENRRRHFGEAVELGRSPRGLDHPAVAPRPLGKKILSTADRLQGTHARSPDRPPRRSDRCRSSTPKCCLSTGPSSARATPSHRERSSLDRSTALPATGSWPWLHREGSHRGKNPRAAQ